MRWPWVPPYDLLNPVLIDQNEYHAGDTVTMLVSDAGMNNSQPYHSQWGNINGTHRFLYWVDREYGVAKIPPEAGKQYKINATFTMPGHDVTLHAYYNIFGTPTEEEYLEYQKHPGGN